MKNYVAVCLLLLSLTITSAEATDSLKAGFRSPPHNAKALTWWHWIDGNMTREGITSDLEAMNEAGLAGAYMFNVGLRLPKGPANFMSPEWIDLVGHTIREADRLGLDFGMHNCDGWSQSGGPWITPQQSMKILTWSSATLDGPRTCSVKLSQPPTRAGFYHDVAVVAFPVTRGTRLNGPSSKVKVSGTLGAAELKLLVDGKKQTRQNFPRASEGRKNSIVFEFAKKVTARSLILHNPGTYTMARYDTGTLEVSDDGKNYRQLSEFEVNWDTRDAPTDTITVGFKAAAGRFFRFSFTTTATSFGFSEVELNSKAYPHLWEAKAGWTRQRDHGGEADSFTNSPAPRNTKLPEGFAVAREDVRIISGKMAADGTLKWNVPKGKWRVLRVGYTSTGKTNVPATKEGKGLECDKFDPAAVRFHMDQYLGKMVERYGKYVGKSFTAFETDSWESHIQNWTDRFEQRFSKAMGYDMLKYLPLLLEGVAIDSLETSEEMMWDWRRFMADQLRENYFMTTHAFAKEVGLTYVSEGSGRQQYMYDPITYQRHNDVPMGEFWTGKTPGNWVRVDNKVAASAAHITGRRYVASESYTSGSQQAKWANHPGLLKAEGDIVFTTGVNRIVFHTFAHQPFPKFKPGFVMGKWGMHNHQGNTWFKQAKAWYEYISRCQYLLQEGRFVADVLYYLGEEVPARVGFRDELHPQLPGGYDFDACDFQAVKEARVVDGIITLPSGMEYKVLLLPRKDAMRPQVVERIAELIEAGAAVVGKMPQRSPSLADGAAGDVRVKQIAEQISEKLYYGISFGEVFKKLGVAPDFEATNKDILYIHRKIVDRDVYFVCNPTDQQISTQCRFRVADRQPEFWHPDTGMIEVAPHHWQDGRKTVVPMTLYPSGSVFVVFAKGKPLPAVRTVQYNGKPMDVSHGSIQPFVADGKLKALIRQRGTYNVEISSGEKINLTVDDLPKEQVVLGSWSVQFPPYWSKAGKVEFPKLISWHKHSDDEVKYFSGTAVYRKSIDIPAEWQSPDRRVVLDLGRVEVIAEVSVNGKKIATLWKPPFEVDITDELQGGGNQLEISVTNLWPNRLIGDERYPQIAELNTWSILKEWPDWLYKGDPNDPNPGPRRTFTTRKIYKATDPLLPSGLIGPVRLRPVAVRVIK
jgi:hypothetical protein